MYYTSRAAQREKSAQPTSIHIRNDCNPPRIQPGKNYVFCTTRAYSFLASTDSKRPNAPAMKTPTRGYKRRKARARRTADTRRATKHQKANDTIFIHDAGRKNERYVAFRSEHTQAKVPSSRITLQQQRQSERKADKEQIIEEQRKDRRQNHFKYTNISK